MSTVDPEPSEPVSWGRALLAITALLLILVLVWWIRLGGGAATIQHRFHPTRQTIQGAAAGSPSPGPELSGVSPRGRVGAALVPQIAGTLPGALLFGGRTTFRGETCFPDLWQWNGARWTQLQVNSPLPCAYPHFSRDSLAAPGASAADQLAAAQVVLVGGGCGACPMETWTADTTGKWSAYTGPAPGARSEFTLASDPTNGAPVLFGGRAGGSGVLLDDTWTWNGKAWARRHPAHSPPARESAGSATTFAGVILFGGVGDRGELGDTWEWTGQDWSELHPKDSPGLRYWPSMAFGISAGGTVLFGGFSSGSYLADTWIWDGVDWKPLVTKTRPAPRANAAFSGDSEGNLVLFGGDESGVAGKDTWTFNGHDWTWKLR